MLTAERLQHYLNIPGVTLTSAIPSLRICRDDLVASAALRAFTIGQKKLPLVSQKVQLVNVEPLTLKRCFYFTMFIKELALYKKATQPS